MNDEHGSAAVLEDLRRRIDSGDLPAGSLLPTYIELGRHYQVSRATLHKAIDRLKRDGLIRTGGRAGMHVVDRPPCHHRYALLLPHINMRDNRFHSTLADAASPLAIARGISLPVIQGFSITSGDAILAGVADEVRARRFAGLLVAGNATAVLDAAGLLNHPIPTVGFQATTPSNRVSCLQPDHTGFSTRACEWLHTRGRRKVAIIVPPLHPALPVLPALMAQYQMVCEPYWQITLDLGNAAAARNIAQLLMRTTPCPDALLLPDDNIAMHALAGLADANAAIGTTIDVVAHANFPLPGPSPQPIRHLGFDVPAMLHRSIDVVNACRRGESVVQEKVPPRFDNEVSTS